MNKIDFKKDVARVGNTFMMFEDFHKYCLCNASFRWGRFTNGAKAVCNKGYVWILVTDEEYFLLQDEQINKSIESIKDSLKIGQPGISGCFYYILLIFIVFCGVQVLLHFIE